MDRPPCVPIEVELQRLHRSPPGTARLRREQRRRERDRRRDAGERPRLARWAHALLRRG
ncbi:MAG: hypothetical protein ACTHNS_00940 [Marmoricola sp.]